MIPIRLLLFVLTTSMLVPMAPASEPPPPTPLTIDPRIPGEREQQIVISPDGSRMAWIRCRDGQMLLGIAEAPFEKPGRALLIGPAVDTIPNPCMGDRHLFWQRGGTVWHTTIDDQALPPARELPFASGPFGLSTNRAGTLLVTLLDGPDTPQRSPGWRAVSSAIKIDDAWQTLGSLTGTAVADMANHLLLATEANRIVYHAKGFFEADWNGTAWTKRPLGLPGWLHPTQLSSDGTLLILTGCDPDERAANTRVAHLWMSRRTEAGWQAPVRILTDKKLSFYSISLSPDGRWLTWVHLDREGDTISRTRLRRMLRNKTSWSQPEDLTEHLGYRQHWNLAIANNGTLAYTTIHGEDYRGFVRRSDGKTIPLADIDLHSEP